MLTADGAARGGEATRPLRDPMPTLRPRFSTCFSTIRSFHHVVTLSSLDSAEREMNARFVRCWRSQTKFGS